ncbi:MAG: S26 family signal peptidase [Halobacteriota archaeon]
MGDDPSDREETAGSKTPDPPRSSPAIDGDREPPTVESGDAGRLDSVDGDEPDPRAGPIEALRWVRSSDNGFVVVSREILTSVLAVMAIGLLLFAVSGVWPPMVAVESGSMEPHLQKGDLVFVMDEQRLPPDAATGDTGVVTYQDGVEHDYRSLGSYGDVIIYHPDGDPNRKPVIHRAHIWVDEGENWVAKADPAFVTDDDCESVPNCPAPHAGFITKGDNEQTNDYYDQTRGISGPVKPEWIAGSAEVRVPWLGWIRLTFSEVSSGYLSAVNGPPAAAA